MGTSFNKLIKGSAIIFVSLIITRGFGFVKSIIFARMLGPNDLGIYGIVFNIQQIMITISVFGIPFAITKYIAENKDNVENEKRNYFTGLILILIFSLTISIIYLFASPLIATEIYKNTKLAHYMSLSALSIVFASLNSFNRAYFQGINKMKEISVLDISNSVIFLVTSFILLYIFGLMGAFYAIILSSVFTSILGIILLKQSKTSISKFEIDFDQETVKKILNFGFPLFLSSITILPTYLLGRTWLAVKYDYDQVGYLQVALAVQTIILFIPSAISTNLFPWFSSNSSKNGQDYLRKKIPQLTRMFTFIMGTIMIIFIPISGYFVNILYGSTYFASIELLQWLLVDTLLISQIQIYNNYVMSISKNYLILKLDIIALFLMVPLLYILIEKYAAIGVAWTFILVRIIVLLLYQRTISKKLNTKLFEDIFAYGLCSMIMIILILIYDTNKIQFAYMFFALLIYSTIYFNFIFKDGDLKLVNKMIYTVLSSVQQKFFKYD